MKNYAHLSKLLRKARQQRNFRQKDFSSIVQIHTQYISNWERGFCSPPEHKFNEILKVLKIKPEQVVEAMLMDAKEEIEKKVYAP